MIRITPYSSDTMIRRTSSLQEKVEQARSAEGDRIERIDEEATANSRDGTAHRDGTATSTRNLATGPGEMHDPIESYRVREKESYAVREKMMSLLIRGVSTSGSSPKMTDRHRDSRAGAHMFRMRRSRGDHRLLG